MDEEIEGERNHCIYWPVFLADIVYRRTHKSQLNNICHVYRKTTFFLDIAFDLAAKLILKWRRKTPIFSLKF